MAWVLGTFCRAPPPVLPAPGYGQPWGPSPDCRPGPGQEGAENRDCGRRRLRQDLAAHGVQPGVLPRALRPIRVREVHGQRDRGQQGGDPELIRHRRCQVDNGLRGSRRPGRRWHGRLTVAWMRMVPCRPVELPAMMEMFRTRTAHYGQEDYDRLRPLSYQNTQLVLICYDVMNPTSYDNVLIKWFPEVTHFCRGIPTVLIGCKTDLRKDKEQLRKLRAAQLEPITYTQGQSACEQIQAALYLECSAKFRENVEDVFREAAKVALSAMKKAQRQKQHRLCLLV
ncbi:rho-related GTP-binding protein RhoF isoform X1 [Balaenoptera musculus]|uniref:Rho-related GTP-binding protein RhoF isoform X1 n=1 Tax=Balaenoptera musculus TaxID=9771 RepID=A0A8B8V1U7_BALMU|nr:rho-related GTP-binding protein RhoF isoform X1 [Balaenoptera musculus]